MNESTELWLPIPEHDGYEVSDFGGVRSIDRLIIRRNGRPLRRQGQILKLARNDGGYYLVDLSTPGVRRMRRVHQLVLETFVGPCPPGHEGCHDNGNRTDNRLSNLYWGTRSQNNLDAVRHGTHGMRSRNTCPREHLLVAPNLVASKLPIRQCLACDRARSTIRRPRLRGEKYDLRAVADEHYQKIMSVGPEVARSVS